MLRTMGVLMSPLLSLLLFFFPSAGVIADPCQDDLGVVLVRYLEARGGAAALDRQHGLRLVSTHHEGRWNPVFDYRVMKPGYMWISATYDDGEVIVEGFDGTRGWEKWGDKPAEYVGGDAEKGVNQGAVSPVHLYGLNHMEDLGAVVTHRGCQRVEGIEYVVINVLSEFGTNIDYYLNARSRRLERSRTVRPLHPTQDPTPIPIEERWSDFRWVDGVLHPFRLELWRVDTQTRLSWLEVHLIERLSTSDPAFFAKPD